MRFDRGRAQALQGGHEDEWARGRGHGGDFPRSSMLPHAVRLCTSTHQERQHCACSGAGGGVA
eukprot:944639-Amphidinium_carterae.1